MMMTELEHARQYLSLQINEVVCWWWCYIREISWQLLIALVAYLCVCVFLYAVLKRVGHAAWQLPGPPGRLLLVTAHPDDEVMFFGPLVYWLARSKASEVYLLCLSMGTCLVITSVPATCSKIARLTIRRVPTGATNKLKPSTANAVSIEVHQCACRWGQKENRRAVGMYEGAGHPSSQCNDYYSNERMRRSSELPDDQGVQWPTDVVAESILQYVEMYRINAVVTFDKHGVSRHKNHISLYFAIAALCIEKKVPPYCKLYVLESVNVIRKYIQLLDLPISLLSASYWYLVTYEQRRTIKGAMVAHKSQYVWFRKLYMVFSRYTFINTLQEVSALDLELDLQFD